MIISLVGYRGSGKSTVAGLLAERLSLSTHDTDRDVERVSGRSIAEIFAEAGEAEFRRLERDAVVNRLRGDNLVLALGGGAILNAETRRELSQHGPVIWLRATPETLAVRIGTDDETSSTRPSLTGRGVIEEIATVLNARRDLYTAASTHIIDVDDLSPSLVADRIISLLESNPANIPTTESTAQ